MDFDFTLMSSDDRYRMLVSFVAPRPIALVTTLSAAGVPNTAPMSFFNVFSQDPPIVILGIQTREDGRKKDTLENIEASREFTVNMVDISLADAMMNCARPFEPEVDEATTAGLTLIPTRRTRGLRVAESPCAMECRVDQTINYARRSIILGEVVQMHVRDDCLTADGRHVRPEAYQPIARLHANHYVVSDRQIQIDMPSAAPLPKTWNGAA